MAGPLDEAIGDRRGQAAAKYSTDLVRETGVSLSSIGLEQLGEVRKKRAVKKSSKSETHGDRYSPKRSTTAPARLEIMQRKTRGPQRTQRA